LKALAVLFIAIVRAGAADSKEVKAVVEKWSTGVSKSITKQPAIREQIASHSVKKNNYYQ
jgi:hypothetical protein